MEVTQQAISTVYKLMARHKVRLNFSYNPGQKVLAHLRKTDIFYRRPFVAEKHLFVDSQIPLDTVTWLQH